LPSSYSGRRAKAALVYNALLGNKINNTYSFQVNVNNLLDQVYYKEFARNGIGYYYGDPRNVMVTLQGKF
jgi:outer membrane receptor for ferric coprogen and ferric-rhodotorulic acid